MPRASKASDQALPEQTLIIDNGGFTIKAGYATPNPEFQNCQTIPNCLARDRERRIWIGSQLDNCRDFGEIVFRRPIEKGCLVNWEAEKAIWDHTFFDAGAQLKVRFSVAFIQPVHGSHAFSAIPMIQIYYSAKHLIPLSRYKPTVIKLFLRSSNLPHIGDF